MSPAMSTKSRRQSSSQSSQSSRSSRASGSGSSSSRSASSSAPSSLPTPPAPASLSEHEKQPIVADASALFRPPGLLWTSPSLFPSPWDQSGKTWASPIPLDGQHPLASPSPVSEAPEPEALDAPSSPASLYDEASRPPSPAASYASRESTDSGVVLDARSKASHVTSLSIPPSPALLRPPTPPAPLTLGAPWFCHAPVPSKPISLLGRQPKATRHSQFYFTDDLVTLNVDGCLFRVHQCILERESTYFRRLFAREVGQGFSDETAIELPQVTVEAFEILLRFVYFGTHEPAACPMEDWISLLAAATALTFPALRERALAELEDPSSSLDALDRLLLADRYDVARWRVPAYVALCMREHPLQESEAALLGVKVASQVAQARERVLLDMLLQAQSPPRRDKAGSAARAPLCKDVRRVERIVEDVFGMSGVAVPHRS
ncbi:hypothetical protein PsYK624_092250 [Phanerochaete sordida]|uniref:BTB domain-containing protein n=1 Tax=Phanerochaete sordida TaxID=48140 RepID=A0A9P3GDT2_9APHY|nr:hypothetical protein PsYK624_092250 [Phanerochaete sordida]